jgi:adenine-specific DNA-methyltransferase
VKYMGSKTNLLRGSLGTKLVELAEGSERFVDLFAGAGSVSHYMAEQAGLPVLSYDLQCYSSVLTGVVTERAHGLSDSSIVREWVGNVRKSIANDGNFDLLSENLRRLGRATVLRGRRNSRKVSNGGFISRDYGGHYFSPQQAYILDLLFVGLPVAGYERTLGLAALIRTASSAAASPGHMAQPFQPTPNLIPHIRSAWTRNVLDLAQRHLEGLAARYAKKIGSARVGDAMTATQELRSTDLVFCDPPYSAVQYSRFYHVLEGIARGGWSSVEGAGRAPERLQRQSSDFSMKSKAPGAMKTLLSTLRERECTTVITFPNADASNGLSAVEIIAMAKEGWRQEVLFLKSTHSTLGGSPLEGGRGSRRDVQEAVIVLRPS